MLIEHEDEKRGEGEEGRTPEEQDRGAEGRGTHPRDAKEPQDSDPHQPSDGRGHTRAGSNVPNAGKDPSQDRRE
jgi:hypothetical protein